MGWALVLEDGDGDRVVDCCIGLDGEGLEKDRL